MRTVVFDNEAIQALRDVDHRKHRRALALVEASAGRNLRRGGAVRLVVPTAVRVEAGWDRRAVKAAPANQLRIADSPLGRDAADRAASIVRTLAVSVADAHLAAVLTTTAGPHAVLTSDATGLRRIAEHTGTDVSIVLI